MILEKVKTERSSLENKALILKYTFKILKVYENQRNTGKNMRNHQSVIEISGV